MLKLSNNKIYVDSEKKETFETPRELLLEVLMGGPYSYSRETYNEDGTIQCDSTKNRSFDDLQAITKTYFPNLSDLEVFEELVKTMIAINYRSFDDMECKYENRSVRFLACSDINKVVVYNEDLELKIFNPKQDDSITLNSRYIFLGRFITSTLIESCYDHTIFGKDVRYIKQNLELKGLMDEKGEWLYKEEDLAGFEFAEKFFNMNLNEEIKDIDYGRDREKTTIEV